MTLHSAMMPHEPGQGSLHLCCMQAILAEHSALIVHSGLQFGGLPLYVGKQEHDGTPPISRHSENMPQGDGMHGSLVTSLTTGGLTATNYEQFKSYTTVIKSN